MAIDGNFINFDTGLKCLKEFVNEFQQSDDLNMTDFIREIESVCLICWFVGLDRQSDSSQDFSKNYNLSEKFFAEFHIVFDDIVKLTMKVSLSKISLDDDVEKIFIFRRNLEKQFKALVPVNRVGKADS